MRRDDQDLSAETSPNSTIAEEAGLVYVNDDDPGITRKVNGKRFSYILPSGAVFKDARTKARIRSLAIPPAWTDVWICPTAGGHIQATGRDARGRKQYRYHPAWQKMRDEAKFVKMLSFAKALPKLRKRIRRDMRRRRLDQRKVLATIVALLESTLIRVGNKEYARTNGSYGLTTLQDRHVSFSKSETRFRFRGKTGKIWHLAISDRRIARIVRSCQELPGQHLFQYEAEDGEIRAVTSDDVNSYLRELSGDADISAKDFRTWAGTVLAAVALSEFGTSTAKPPPSATCAALSKALLIASATPRRSVENAMYIPKSCSATSTGNSLKRSKNVSNVSGHSGSVSLRRPRRRRWRFCTGA